MWVGGDNAAGPRRRPEKSLEDNNGVQEEEERDKVFGWKIQATALLTEATQSCDGRWEARLSVRIHGILTGTRM